MEFLYWCNHEFCPCFDNYTGYIKMENSRNDYIEGIHYNEPNIYGGIVTLSILGMLGYGIQPRYVRDSCKHDDILIIAVERGPTIETTKILGFITAIIQNKRCIEINIIGSRSGHSGIGSTLMYHLLEVSRNCGFSVCILKSLVHAMTFYLKSGFTYLGTSRSILGDADPIFAINLNDSSIIARPHLQRQNSTEPIILDNRSLEEIEQSIYHTIPRNIPLDRYIDQIGSLKPGEPWDFLYNRIETPLGFVSNGGHSVHDRSRGRSRGRSRSRNQTRNKGIGNRTVSRHENRSRNKGIGSRGRSRGRRILNEPFIPKGLVPNPVKVHLHP